MNHSHRKRRVRETSRHTQRETHVCAVCVHMTAFVSDCDSVCVHVCVKLCKVLNWKKMAGVLPSAPSGVILALQSLQGISHEVENG